MSDTCQLSHGEASTGIRGVICGFISPRWATSSVKPERRKPKGRTKGKRRSSRQAVSKTTKATNCIVS